MEGAPTTRDSSGVGAWAVRAPLAREASLFAAVMPPSLAGHCRAVCEDDARMVGLAAIDFAGNNARGWVHVAPRDRRRGLGSMLLTDLLAEARRRGARDFKMAEWIDPESGPADFLRRNGFEACDTLRTWENDVEACRSLYGRAYRRLEERGMIPKNLRLLCLQDAPKDQVAELVLESMPFDRKMIEARLRGGVGGYAQSISQIACLGERVVGAALASSQGACMTTDIMVVTPSIRSGWLPIVLKHAGTEIVYRRGFTRQRFVSNPTLHPGTEKMAQRLGARLISARSSYRRRL